MVRFFNKLFNIRTHEWPHVLLLFCISGLSNVGGIWGGTIAYAAFLNQIGIGMLSWVLVISSVLSVLAIAVYSAFADRIRNDTLLIALYVVGIFNIVLALILFRFNLSSVAYPLLYLIYLAWLAVRNPHFVTYINSFYDIQSAKRVLPVVMAGSRAGAILAGFSMPLLTSRFTPSAIILLWLLIHLIIIVLLRGLPHLLKRQKPQSSQPASTGKIDSEKHPPSFVDNMQEGFRYTVQSTYLRWMATGSLLLMIIMALIEYRSSNILLNIYQNPEELANFLAILVGIGNVIVLPMLLFAVSRIITRLGLGNTSLIFPVGNFIVCGGLVFAPGLLNASAAHFVRRAFRIGFHSPIDSLLYNAVPLRIKGRARAFVSGLVRPVGTLVGGILLVLPFVSTSLWLVPALIALLTIVYTVSVVFIRRQYSKALIEMLEQEDYSFLLSQEASDFTVADPATLAQLQKKLNESTSYEFTIFMAQLISQLGGKECIPILAQEARSATDAKIRAAIVDVLVATDLREDALQQLYRDLLNDQDGQVRQSAIAGLAHISDHRSQQFLDTMLAMLQDPELEVRVQALSILANSHDFYQFTPATHALKELLKSEEPSQRTHGARVLGLINDERAIQQLLDFLFDPADEVRLEAALAVERLSESTLPESSSSFLAEKIDILLRDPIERVRQAALKILGILYASGRLDIQTSHQALIEALTDVSPQIRATAVDTLVQMGKAVIPVIHPQLNSSSLQLRKMAAVVLSRVNPREFSPLITGTSIMGNLLAIYKNHGLEEALKECPQCSGFAILQSALQEQSQQFLEEIFYLLAAIHDSSNVRLIRESLRNENQRIRANALEALESLTTPQTTRLIGPLFEPDVSPARLFTLGKEIWEMEPPDLKTAVRQLVSHADDCWMQTIIIFALGEIAAALIAPSSQPPQQDVREEKLTTNPDPLDALTDDVPRRATSKRRRTNRAAPVDLFSALDGDSANSSGTPTTAPAPDNIEKTPETEEPHQPIDSPLSLSEIKDILKTACDDPAEDVRIAAQKALQRIDGLQKTEITQKEDIVLSVIEKVIFLKEVPFFQGMTIEQLKILANVCEEKLFEEDTRIFNAGDSGGTLYVVVNGKVGIEREKRKGSFARLADVEAHSYFGEMNLFDGSARTTSAIALQDTLTLQLRREPLIELARRYPDLSLELINVLSQRLRETNDRIAELTRTRPRELHKLFDQFD